VIETTHQWLARLEDESVHLASLNCRRSDPDRRLDYDGFNLANCDAHCRLIIRGIESVLNSANHPGAPTRLPSWVYLNPRAKHRLSHGHMAFFRADNVHGFRIDGFADDNY
jgi:hypothetical protein